MIAPPRRTAAASLAAALVSLALAAAALAPPSHAADTRSASLCSVAKGVAAQIVEATGLSPNTTMTPAKLKTLYLTVQRNEPALLGAAHGPMKTSLHNVFGFVNLVIADFQKTNWQLAGMVKYFPSLEAKGAAIQGSLQKVKTYFQKTCKFKNG